MSFKQRNKVLQYVTDSGEVHYLNKILFDNQDMGYVQLGFYLIFCMKKATLIDSEHHKCSFHLPYKNMEFAGRSYHIFYIFGARIVLVIHISFPHCLRSRPCLPLSVHFPMQRIVELSRDHVNMISF